MPDRNIFLTDTDWSALGSCGGTKQSPINITTTAVVAEDLSNFTTSMGYKIYSTGKIQNTGYSRTCYYVEIHHNEGLILIADLF